MLIVIAMMTTRRCGVKVEDGADLRRKRDIWKTGEQLFTGTAPYLYPASYHPQGMLDQSLKF
jgi:hypothetical protein